MVRPPITAGQVVVLGTYFSMLTGSVGSVLNLVPITARGTESVRSIAEVLEDPDVEWNEGKPTVDSVEGRIELRRLLREALRMRPDRIVVGECRGPEALDLLLALNSGHHGSLGTIHANSPRDALQRLETLALLAGENLGTQALQNLILGGVQVVVQLGRVNGRRRVTSVAEVKGVDGGRFLLKELSF